MTMSHYDLYKLALGAGLNDGRAKVAAAIAMAESGGDPNAHNAVPPDDSYGLWQINMLGSLGPERRKQFGISDNSALYSPETNARAMATLSQNGGNFSPWSTYTNGAYRKYYDTQLIQTTGDGPDASSNPLDGLLPGSPLSSIDKVIEMFNKTAAWVSNSENWLRVGYVTGGTVVIVVGLVMIVGSTSAGKAVIGLTPAGKVGKIAKVAKGSS